MVIFATIYKKTGEIAKVLLFAGGLISGALGIVVVWLGLWSAIRIISKLIAKTRA